MAMPDAWAFTKLGTRERVLLLGQIVEPAEEGAGGVRLTERARMLFGGRCPSLGTLLPPLLGLVEAEAADRCGFLAGGELRLEAVARLHELGLPERARPLLVRMVGA